MNFKYLSLVFLCLLVLGSVSFSIGTEPYFQVVNTSMRYGASPISSTLNQYIALVAIDTTNTTVVNTTHPVGVSFTNANDNSTRLFAEYDSMWGTNTTYIWVGPINQTNATQIVVWSDPTSSESVNYSVATLWRTANYTAVFHGNDLFDSANGNTMVIYSGSVAYSNLTSKCAIGNCALFPTNSYGYTGTVIGIGQTEGTMTGWTYRQNVETTNYLPVWGISGVVNTYYTHMQETNRQMGLRNGGGYITGTIDIANAGPARFLATTYDSSGGALWVNNTKDGTKSNQIQEIEYMTTPQANSGATQTLETFTPTEYFRKTRKRLALYFSCS